MLKINNTKLKKYRIPLIFYIVGIGGIFLFQYLTFIPEYSTATTIETPIYAPGIEVRTLTDIDYMSELTSEICGNTKTPAAFLEDGATINPNVPTKQLIDDREESNGTKYWISKLADGNCWMAQNMDYVGNMTAGNFYDPGLVVVNDANASLVSVQNFTIDNSLNIPVDSTLRKYNTHYLVGNYYMQASSQSAKACNFTSLNNDAWRLPASSLAGSFENLMNTYKLTNNSSGSLSLRSAPFYYVLAGLKNSNGLQYVGTGGRYWSSETNRILYLRDGGVSPNGEIEVNSVGYSARCLVEGMGELPNPEVPNPNISVDIPSIITLDVYSEDEDNNVIDIVMDNDGTGVGEFMTKVSSNSTYNLSLSAVGGGHTDLRNDKTNTSIPALSSTNPIVTEADESWWGIKCTNPTDSTNCTKTAYTGLTLNPDTYFTSTSGTPTTGTETPFTIGIKISPSLPSGTYSTSIQVTASSTGSN